MAVVNDLEPGQVRAALTEWLAGKLPEADSVEITNLDVPSASGMSMTTILLNASVAEGGERRVLDLVARVAPQEAGLFPSPDLQREFDLMRVLADGTPVPVPAPRWIEPDASVLGAEFVVIDRKYGRTPADDPPYTVAGWVLDLSPDERAAMVRNGLKVLASVNAVDWRGLGLDRLDEPRFGRLGIEQELGRLRNFYAWAAEGSPSPTIDAGFEWVDSNAPSGDDLVLNWGDPRIGNMIFGDDQSVQAAVDWEMATIASPSMDLAWWLFLQRHHTEGIGAPLPKGFPDRAETISIYEELSGRTVADLDFYEALAGLRSAIIMLRIGSMTIAAGVLPDDHPLPYANPSSALLAKLLDLPAPAGATKQYLGDRG
jgi:aminoglycoside phosphotransferase (APT) family kinase protein